MSVIRWEDPPPPQRRPGSNQGRRASTGRWAAVAADLRTRPGAWALVQVSDRWSSVAGNPQNIRAGKLAGFKPPGAFEAIFRLVGDEARCYARYVGEST